MMLARVLFTAAAMAAGIVVRDPQRSDGRVMVGGCRGGCDATSGWVAEVASAGLADRLKVGDWKRRFEMMVEAGHSEPCSPDIMTTSYGRFVGLGSRIDGFVDELILGMFRAGSFRGGLSLCDGRDGFYAQWQSLFKNNANFSSCHSDGLYCRNGDSWDTLHLGVRLAQALRDSYPEYLDGLKCFLYRRVFTYNKETQKNVDKLLQSAGLDRHTPYVAVHIRRGDKIQEASQTPTSAYVDSARPFLNGTQRRTSILKAVRNEVEAAGIKQVFLATDDENAWTELNAELGDRVRIVRQPPGADVTIRWYGQNENTMSLFADIEALKHANVFLGTGSSGLGRLVYYLRDRKRKSISLDEGDFQART